MVIHPIKTKRIEPGEDLFEFIRARLESVPNRSVMAIASKVFSFAENRLIQIKTGTKEEKYKLVRQEAESYLEPNQSKYELMFTIKGNWMFVNAGLDESNAAGRYSLWPKDPQASLNLLWQKLREHYRLKEFGMIMTDSRSFPLNWGVTGHGIAHCGFEALNSYIGVEDLFGRELQMEQVSVIQSLAAAAAFEMGEGAERQPLALITQIKQNIKFQDRPPTKSELDFLHIDPVDDIYAPMITAVPWKKGGS